MGASERIGRDLELVRSREFTDACRRAPTDFTRRRKMPCDVLVESMLCRKGRSLKIELREFERDRMTDTAISAPGYLRQREKLNPEAMARLMRHHAAQVCSDGDAPRWHGMHVLAIDGSTCNVPTNAATTAAYGGSSARHGKVQAFLGLSAVFDVLARQMVGLEVTSGGFDERSFVPAHVRSAREALGDEPFVLVMDRGYPSFPLLAWLTDNGVPYLMRAQSVFMNAEFRDAGAAGGDTTCEFDFAYQRIASIRKRDPEEFEALLAHGPIEVRCVLADIGGGAPEKLVTNLPPERFAPNDLKELYHLRWGVETCFQMLKDRLQMENMTGTKPILIEQDIYASAYLLNVAFDIANEADAKARTAETRRRYRHEMTVNRSFALGVVKGELLQMIMADDSERDAIMARIVEELSSCLVPVRKDRSYPRDGIGSNYANRYSNTHKRVF
ncbi:MAG: IS4 family transposase [Olsenella sp.]|nr:IS4 family transposase [Olsenella sp.]